MKDRFTLYTSHNTVRDGTSADGNDYGTQVINDETWWVPPGSASVIESTFPAT